MRNTTTVKLLAIALCAVAFTLVGTSSHLFADDPATDEPTTNRSNRGSQIEKPDDEQFDVVDWQLESKPANPPTNPPSWTWFNSFYYDSAKPNEPCMGNKAYVLDYVKCTPTTQSCTMGVHQGKTIYRLRVNKGTISPTRP